MLLSGCAGQQVRNLEEQNELLARENAELAERLQSTTTEQMRLAREVDRLLQQRVDRGRFLDLEQEHQQLRRENTRLRELLEETLATALDEGRPLPDQAMVAAEELQLFRSQLRDSPLPRDTGGAFIAVADVSAADLAPPGPRSPLANSGIVVEEVNGLRRYYDAVVNRSTPRALYLMIEMQRGLPAELFMVVNERYPRSEPPLAFRRVTINGDSGSIALPISAGSSRRLQDSRHRFESVRFGYSSAVEAAVRVAIESEHPTLELGGIGAVAQRPISDAELTALTNMLYAFDTLSAARR
ncbi:MAG: hypothetical protein EA404_13470 [Spirochaetaceae bacterium]|nr:MAG: hypothetical protein EA404_13470 [Spirochaetaceae bacterium]